MTTTDTQTKTAAVAEIETIMERVEAMRRELREIHNRLIVLLGKIEGGGK